MLVVMKKSDLEHYAYLDRILHKYNPCKITITNNKASCIGGKICCAGCQFLTQNGCSVISLSCKWYFCTKAWQHLPYKIRVFLIKIGDKWKTQLYFRHNQESMETHIQKSDYIITPLNPPFVW